MWKQQHQVVVSWRLGKCGNRRCLVLRAGSLVRRRRNVDGGRSIMIIIRCGLAGRKGDWACLLIDMTGGLTCVVSFFVLLHRVHHAPTTRHVSNPRKKAKGQTPPILLHLIGAPHAHISTACALLRSESPLLLLR